MLAPNASPRTENLTREVIPGSIAILAINASDLATDRRVDTDTAIFSSVARVRVLRIGGLVLSVLALSACDALHSDSENFQRRARAEREARLAGMRAATAQTPVGRRLVGEDLRGLVEGKTHVSVFERTPSGRHARYVEYRYYAAGGRFVYVNTEWATDPAGNPDDRWRVDGARLCVLNHAFSEDERCYTVAVAPDGAVQFFSDDPGSEYHGLITSVVHVVYDGPPRPERSAGR
jgi:hypothetical protein